MPRRINFNPKLPLVAARAFTFAGKDYNPGDPFAPEGADQRLLARQYESRAVNHGESEAEAPAEQVTMTGPAGGRYTITAPWLAEPEVVRGKANAEARLAELRAEGAPLGFIDGGSAVTVEGGEGGWYEVNAPWLDEAEKVQGREAAELRQRELHAAGEPDSHSGYTLTPGENGWYAITKDGVEGTDGAEAPVLKVQGEDKAREAVAQLRAGETPEDTALPAEWEPKELEPVEGYAATVLVTQDNDTFTVTAGGREPESFDTAEAAEARQAELRAGEPPEGWTPDAEQQPAPSVEGTGNDAPEDSTVDKKDPNERAEELGNQPNAAEDAADEQRAGTEGSGKTPAGSGGDAHAVESGDDDGGDGTTGTVGP